MPATSLSLCLQLTSYSRYNPVAISESKCIQIKVVYEKSLMHLLGSELQFHKASFLLKMLNRIFTHLMQDKVVFLRFAESALVWSYLISFSK